MWTDGNAIADVLVGTVHAAAPNDCEYDVPKTLNEARRIYETIEPQGNPLTKNKLSEVNNWLGIYYAKRKVTPREHM